MAHLSPFHITLCHLTFHMTARMRVVYRRGQCSCRGRVEHWSGCRTTLCRPQTARSGRRTPAHLRRSTSVVVDGTARCSCDQQLVHQCILYLTPVGRAVEGCYHLKAREFGRGRVLLGHSWQRVNLRAHQSRDAWFLSDAPPACLGTSCISFTCLIESQQWHRSCGYTCGDCASDRNFADELAFPNEVLLSKLNTASGSIWNLVLAFLTLHVMATETHYHCGSSLAKTCMVPLVSKKGQFDNVCS